MLSRRIAAARPLTRALQPAVSRTTLTQIRHITQADIEDPGMNGGYINPPAEKRQFRDPYADWWDKQERRNYGEPVHEDNDILGMFSTEQDRHFTPGWGAVLLGTFVASVLGLCAIVLPYYPDKPAVPRAFPGGLDRELGGGNALLVSVFLGGEGKE
ncbi:NADH dehydrogenase (ubiquinone) 1 beta subcomplex 8 [Coniosporium apollinis CBS 100218]|uniref:NADH dehydrogenase (Ubiquinone) 1 beta subcomplex 8 n=1 Tax=Coniosporium apollinis (strain CBS 100218) TaxID=1168221 RepID=R7YZN7_CONA1|nr:NADH dehydrogenase (ubiquinone) 1 beta subcomplex 8 [Coniosporium apollinis CBS 100218]EON67091.1 NADH dehydrogenase (ubiquinone) 1 beta subcomplex 8 [Coniosporium apollinis CBS 100218]